MAHSIKISDLNITIVGLGLMGGSIAKALHGHTGRITAVDVDPNSLEIALAQGVISRGTDDLEEGVANADVIILAIPVSLIVDTLHKLPQLKKMGCLIMDLGSTKVSVTEAMSALPDRFDAIGGHPMCGREQSGFLASTSALYKGQKFILCRNQRTSRRAEEISLSFVEAIQAHPLFLDALLHDQIVALTSHLPYLLSALITSRVSDSAVTDERYWQISATGLRDVSRLAGSNPKMMMDILQSNKTKILQQLHLLDMEMKQLIHNLEEEDLGDILSWLQSVSRHHDAYMNYRWPRQDETKSDFVDK